ncbi:iron(3+)-hydroxamate import system permease protein FhuB [Pullulanibacillus camelliae]|uniref:Iron(3+)-hydroxamate import system permease protein FhuB n=1 Tax=Pullulanibacillus camelliae TaxID=1707096 RepID=A0A8J3E015_9BACL|nr:iron ABC transporter permease [Pullulanibacillus camelliae]GGE53028.1 iron(3+)-hydroxamate import system permease protein FhuB [Pullulanibacillus camelliae]
MTYRKKDRAPSKIDEQKKHKPINSLVVIVLGLVALLFAFGFSVAYGAADIQLSTVWKAIVAFNPDISTHQVIREIRIPRSLAAVLVGAFLAVAGTIMQGLTQNPLASPSIMGVTDGAAFAIVLVLAFASSPSNFVISLIAFIGAGMGVALVFAIGALSKSGLTPVKLTLAGVAVGTLLRSISSAIALQKDVAKNMSFWYAGGLDGTTWTSIHILIVAGFIGFLLAGFIAHSMTLLSLGDEVSTGLGQNTTVVKVIGAIVVLVLTGSAVAVAGTVGFIGLVVPHITRFLIGHDYRTLLPASAVLGSLLLVLSDLVARMINNPYETPVGAITAAIGVPFFLYLARSERRGL